MSKKCKVGIIAIILTLAFVIPINVMAATNKAEATSVNYNAKAKAVTNGWVKASGKWFYYKGGKVVTGWQTIKGKIYYFKKVGGNGVKGRMFTDWQVIDKKTFYFGGAEDGALRTGWQKMSNKWFYFSRAAGNGKKGKMLLGWQKIDGKMYYLKKAGGNGTLGKMFTGWQKISNQVFNFGGANDGAMKMGWQNIGGKNFYFQTSGAKGAQGKILTNWQTISGKKYYFKPSGAMGVIGENLRNGNYTIDGKSYYFDKNGVLTTAPAPDYINMVDPTNGKTYKVEPEIKTDPQIGSKNITEEAFFAAVLYTEAGDQGYAGQLMVAMTILNRVVDKGSYWPNSLKFVVYQDQNFAVARKYADGSPGSLTKVLREIDSRGYTAWKSNAYHAESAKAAKAALKKIADWKKDPKKNPRTINAEITKLIMAANKAYGIKNTTATTEFNHTYFMTPAAWNRGGFNAKGCQVFTYQPNPKNSGHVFFRKWVKN